MFVGIIERGLRSSRGFFCWRNSEFMSDIGKGFLKMRGGLDVEVLGAFENVPLMTFF